MSKYAANNALVKLVVELRDAGTPWDAKDGIVDQVRAAFPTYTTKSAIPLRKIYQGAKAKASADHRLPRTAEAITAARDSGAGWDHIAQATGATVAEVKKLYTGEYKVGRVYVSADGSVNHRVEATGAKAQEPTIAYRNDRG